MKKALGIALIIFIFLTSCTSVSFFAGSVGGVYLTSDDYSEENATAEFDNNYNSLKGALWGYFGSKNAPATTGNKVLFYSDLDEDGFYNELVPDRYRAVSLDDAGFVIVAEEADPIFYNTYKSGSTDCKVYYGTGVLKLYSVKTGKLLYVGTAVKGPTPPQQISVYVGTTSLTYDGPKASAFKSQIANICSKIASGQISGSIPDAEAMEAVGAKVPSANNDSLSIQGVWSASAYDETIKMIFTNDGLWICEEWEGDICLGVDIDTYEFKDGVLSIAGYEEDYNYSGKKLTLNLFSSEFQFVQKSKKAENKAGLKSLFGVWEGGNGFCNYIIGLTSDGFAIYQGSRGDLTDFTADNENFQAFGTVNPYYIIDDVLYFEDDGFFDEYDVLRFEHKTKKGYDTTSEANIIKCGELTYADRDGLSGDIFRFFNNGKFSDVPFDEYQKYSQKSGTYSYSDHVLYLSDGREYSIAIIDNNYIGSTI